MKLDAVAGLEVGDLGDGESYAVAGDTDVDARADEVKARVGEARPNEAEEQDATEGNQTGALRHALSLDAAGGRRLAKRDGASYFAGEPFGLWNLVQTK